MNRVILMGRLVADPECATTQSGISRAGFRLAVDRRRTRDGERQADFLQCIAWRGTADFVRQYLRKGEKVVLEGMIQTRTYDAQDGSRRYAVEIVVDHIDFCGGGRDEERQAPAPAQEQGGFIDVTDEDDQLPF